MFHSVERELSQQKALNTSKWFLSMSTILHFYNIYMNHATNAINAECNRKNYQTYFKHTEQMFIGSQWTLFWRYQRLNF